MHEHNKFKLYRGNSCAVLGFFMLHFFFKKRQSRDKCRFFFVKFKDLRKSFLLHLILPRIHDMFVMCVCVWLKSPSLVFVLLHLNFSISLSLFSISICIDLYLWKSFFPVYRWETNVYGNLTWFSFKDDWVYCFHPFLLCVIHRKKMVTSLTMTSIDCLALFLVMWR